MRVTFYGAAGQVTGSKHLVETSAANILLDCGLHQGRGRDSQAENLSLPFAADTIDAVVISHAHLDHVGMLPVLVKNGFRGRIYATGATRDLAELIMLDAAHVQAQEVEFANRHRLPGEDIIQPLYTADDVPPVMRQFDAVPYFRMSNAWTTIAEGVRLKLLDAGHILGSSVIVLEADGQRLVFTGDLGRKRAPLLHDPEFCSDPAATLITESTYGDRLHHPVGSVDASLVAVVKEAVAASGKIIVPAFSLGRTQMLIYLLHRLTDHGRIPRIPIVIDSPLAKEITAVFSRHQRDYDAESKRDFARPGEDPLAFSNLEFTQSVEESKALNGRPGPLMIISASGMASGGRVLHHLRNNLPSPGNTVLFTGYQAAHTPGRRLVSGVPDIAIFGQRVPVRARIVTINDLSAHADAEELREYAAAIPGLRQLFFVHGEPDRAEALSRYMLKQHPSWMIRIPSAGQGYTL